MKPPIAVFVLAGQTASGKTALLECLFGGTGAVCPAEVVSADSMQVYRFLDIGTAKPPPSLRRKVPHHLIDILEPEEQFNAGDFARRAAECIRGIAARRALPVVSGGTGFYISALLDGIPAAPPSSATLRAELKREAAERGIEALREELRARDEESFRRIHPHDTYRLLRALEICRLTGRPMPKPGARSAGAPKGAFQFFPVYITMERETLYRRIDARTEEMFRAGLPTEVAALAARGYTPDCPSLKAIGYAEFFARDEEGAWQLRRDMDAVKAEVALHSRHYAKRQETWFKRMKNMTHLDATAGPPLDAVRCVVERCRAAGADDGV